MIILNVKMMGEKYQTCVFRQVKSPMYRNYFLSSVSMSAVRVIRKKLGRYSQKFDFFFALDLTYLLPVVVVSNIII